MGEEFPTVFHQEDTIDVRVVKLGQFGEVVRKTYLKQTMSEPYRPHSYLQDQLLYEAAIFKSFADVKGVVPVIGWSHCLKSGFPEPEQLRSVYFPYIKGNTSPTDRIEIQDYMYQLLTVSCMPLPS